MEVKGVDHRVHVCAHVPCTNVHPASKQKAGVAPPVHVRLMYWGPDASGHEPAVAGGGNSGRRCHTATGSTCRCSSITAITTTAASTATTTDTTSVASRDTVRE